MADCIDALIDANLVATLKTMTLAAGYNYASGTVERVRTIQEINNRYPYTLVIQLEPEQVEEFGFRDDKLNYIIWYLDGKNDRNETADSEFTYRLRNYHADIIKLLKTDVSRGGYAQNTHIPAHGIGVFDDGTIQEPGAWVVVEIDRIVDANNPYLLG